MVDGLVVGVEIATGEGYQTVVGECVVLRGLNVRGRPIVDALSAGIDQRLIRAVVAVMRRCLVSSDLNLPGFHAGCLV